MSSGISSIAGGVAGLIIGIAIAWFAASAGGDSIAVVDPSNSVIAIVIIAISTLVGAVLGWLIGRRRG